MGEREASLETPAEVEKEAAPCPSVGERSWWDSDILGSVFFLSPMLLIMCVLTYFVKVLVHGDVHVCMLSLPCLPNRFMVSWEYPVCSTDRGSGPGKVGHAGVALFPFDKSRTNAGFEAQAGVAMHVAAGETQTQTRVGP